MIDENKITEAANKFVGHGPEVDEGVSVSMRRDAFRKGAEWFKQSLWHNAKEEPELNKKLIVQYTNYMGDIDYEVDINDSLLWKDWVMSYRISKWCYIEDILPKGGDK